jgi:predicted DNA-binding WGR domain protein
MNDQALTAGVPHAPSRTLRELIAAQAGMPLSTDDVLVLVLPLLRQAAALHAAGRVAILDTEGVVVAPDGALALRQPAGTAPRSASDAIARVQPAQSSGLNIVGALELRHGQHGGPEAVDLALQSDAAAPIERPVFLPGPASWEQALGHHDELTDVFLLGMTLAALACGLDFADAGDLEAFVRHRGNLFALNVHLHPVLAAVIVEMTEPNRHWRPGDVDALATRLRTWREQPVGLDLEGALSTARGPVPRRAAVLGHLRDRLFDLSRRNRLLYFRPTANTVNLTVASVPLMLQVDRIEADQICTWGGSFAADISAGKPVALQRWLRFDDQPYLPGAFDHLIADTRRDRAEFGFSNLRLVVAFLRWHNLKEAPDERIVTPLLWLSVELVRRKGVRDQYVLQATDDEAEFNPVLRHQLAQLYDIRLPDRADLSKTSLADIHADLLAQIRRSEPAVELRLVDKAAIRMVRQKALQRMQQYERRRPASGRVSSAAGLPPYSYARDDYRPLGRALFEQWVRPSPLPQRFEAGAPPAVRQPRMAAAAAERTGYVLEESDGHRYAWDLDLTQVTLANFNYKKMSLVRDYAQLLAEPAANPAFDRVFSIEPRALDDTPPARLALREQWNVVDADATQNAAVALARDGRSFIIQGPPGTGKSQSITNLIADYAGRGKRVLFVCEKRAALDVVFSRLRQSGLDTLCCLIHDSQTDKKAFIADLKSCYEAWIGRSNDDATARSARDAVLAGIEAQQRGIDDFELAAGNDDPAAGTNARALLRRLAALPASPDATAALRERLPALAAWDGQRELLLRLHRFMRERFGLESLAAHPFAYLGPALVADPGAYGRTEQLCTEGDALLQSLDTVPDAQDAVALLDHDMPLGRAAAFAAECRRLLDSGLAPHLDLLDAGSPARAALGDARDALARQARVLADAKAANDHWRDRLSPTDTGAALALARGLEHTFGRWLQPQWWRLRAELKRRYDFGRHAVHPGYVRVLEGLAKEHEAAAALDALDAEQRRRYGVADTRAFIDACIDMERRLEGDEALRALVAQLRHCPAPAAAARAAAGTLATLEGLMHIAGMLSLQARDLSLAGLAELLRDLRESLDDLPDALPLLRAVHGGDAACAALLCQADMAPPALDALVADEALRRLLRARPVLERFDGAALAQAARAVASGLRELLASNAGAVQATRRHRFDEHVRLSATSATQLDADAKAFKKRYANGRRELEHEFGKTMRHRSIRDLADDDTGLVVNDLKPIWLMSPLSVSDTLPLDSGLFDVVIFDEASQIPVEEAVPALSRARQVVVVGDEMQLPPTSFFAAGAGASDELDVEEDGERIAISLDADSLLSQAARNLPATLLAWHYRSRHEALISFSNAAFYAGGLVTIPDRQLELEGEPPAPLLSSALHAGTAAVDALMQRPVSFHRIADGVYADRRNLPEARTIAAMVRELLRRGTGMSVGIVAFSEAQQRAIEEALDALALDDPEFGVRLEQEYAREDDNQFNGLFVKNLENVQGDERDVIILSICYAPGPEGRMLMNFGPINQRGGEKRLNVIFSRARHRMAVVSSIGFDAITNVHNDGASALKAFLQFAQASAAGQFGMAQAVLGGLNAGAGAAFARQPAADTIRDALAEALRARGHEVRLDVGRSQFRCDLAIVDGQRRAYAMGILLDDPGRAVADTMERYVFRPQILRAFGWRVLDLPARDWHDDRAAVIARIEALLGDREDPALERQLEHTAVAAPAVPQDGPRHAPEPVPVRTDAEPGVVRALTSEQGTSRKFWRATLRGTELEVAYGRIGSAGQQVLKQFDTSERARREMDKLVAEKLRKGYVEGQDQH